jgi:hypothetical protein
MPPVARVLIQVLLLEASCIAAGIALFNVGLGNIGGGGFGVVVAVGLTAIPTPLYLGWRLSNREPRRRWRHHLGTGIWIGVVIAAGISATAFFVDLIVDPCRSYAYECMEGSTGFFGSMVAGVLVFPSFVLLTPLSAWAFSKRRTSVGEISTP